MTEKKENRIITSGPMFEPAKHGYWESTHNKSGGHYNSYGLAVDGMVRNDLGMDALREIFPDGKASEECFVLFSTSGVHGTYATIEEIEERVLAGPETWEEGIRPSLTFLIIHPRAVCTRHGCCEPISSDDFSFLKRLRQSSWECVLRIGAVSDG